MSRFEYWSLVMFEDLIVAIVEGNEEKLDRLIEQKDTFARELNVLFETKEGYKDTIEATLRTAFPSMPDADRQIMFRQFHKRTPLTIAIKVLSADQQNTKRRNILAKLLATKPLLQVAGESLNVFQQVVMAGDEKAFNALSAHFKSALGEIHLQDLISAAAYTGQAKMVAVVDQLIPHTKESKDKDKTEAVTIEQKDFYNESFDMPLTKSQSNLFATLLNVFGNAIVFHKRNARYELPNATPLMIALITQATTGNLIPTIKELLRYGASFQKMNLSYLRLAYNYVVCVATEDDAIALFNILVIHRVAEIILKPDASGFLAIHHAAKLDKKKLVPVLLEIAPHLQAVTKNVSGQLAVQLAGAGTIKAELTKAEQRGDLIELRKYIKSKLKTSDANSVPLLDEYNRLLDNLHSSHVDNVIMCLDAIYNIKSAFFGLVGHDKHKNIVAAIFGDGSPKDRETPLDRIAMVNKQTRAGALIKQFKQSPDKFLKIQYNSSTRRITQLPWAEPTTSVAQKRAMA